MLTLSFTFRFFRGIIASLNKDFVSNNMYIHSCTTCTYLLWVQTTLLFEFFLFRVPNKKILRTSFCIIMASFSECSEWLLSIVNCHEKLVNTKKMSISLRNFIIFNSLFSSKEGDVSE